MFIIIAIRPNLTLFIQFNVNKNRETKTNDKNIINKATAKPIIHGPRNSSDIKPTKAMTNTDKKNLNFEKSNK